MYAHISKNNIDTFVKPICTTKKREKNPYIDHKYKTCTCPEDTDKIIDLTSFNSEKLCNSISDLQIVVPLSKTKYNMHDIISKHFSTEIQQCCIQHNYDFLFEESQQKIDDKLFDCLQTNINNSRYDVKFKASRLVKPLMDNIATYSYMYYDPSHIKCVPKQANGICITYDNNNIVKQL